MGTRKMYGGAAVATTLNGAIAGGATSIVVTAGASYPDGSGGPFVIAIDRGVATEEKILIASRSGNTLTVTTRGYDGTSAQAHSNGAAVEHVLDAVTIDEANRAASLLTTKGDLFTRDGSNLQRLAVGANDARLVADSAQGTGLRWAANDEQKLIDAKGDLLGGSAADTLIRLAVGTNTFRLVADSTQASGLRWANETEFNLVDAKGDLLVGSADNTLVRKAVGTDRSFLMADAASAGGVKWNSGALSAWTPAVTQLGAVGGTFNGLWQRNGRMVTAFWLGTCSGPGTTLNAITVSLPVAADTNWVNNAASLGVAHWFKASSGFSVDASVVLGSGTVMQFRLMSITFAADRFLGLVVPVEFGLASGDILSGCVTYPAAAD